MLVDDYDLVATGPANPLPPLVEFLPQARDIGLHLVLTRRAGGAGRALYEPIIQRLRELSSPGLVMSGDNGRGSAGRHRPARRRCRRAAAGWSPASEGVRLVQLAHLPPTGRHRQSIAETPRTTSETVVSSPTMANCSHIVCPNRSGRGNLRAVIFPG